MPKEDFKREVEKELTGKDSEPSELIFLRFTRARFRSSSGQLRLQPLCSARTNPVVIAWR